jgi:hypothetical protein
MDSTSGLNGSGLSLSVDLLGSLESKFRARTASLGSTLFDLTWKERTTPSGYLISQLAASARRIADSVSTSPLTPVIVLQKSSEPNGWPTPVSADARSSARHGYMIKGNQGSTLLDAARLTSVPSGWATPLPGQVKLSELDVLTSVPSGWATPVSQEAGGTPEQFIARKQLARENGSKLGLSLTSLSLQAQLTKVPLAEFHVPMPMPMPTPSSSVWYEEQLSLPVIVPVEIKDSDPEIASASTVILPGKEVLEDYGLKTSNGSIAVPNQAAKTAAGGQLAPALSRWLQGIPPSWEEHAPPRSVVLATPLSDPSRGPSLKR